MEKLFSRPPFFVIVHQDVVQQFREHVLVGARRLARPTHFFSYTEFVQLPTESSSFIIETCPWLARMPKASMMILCCSGNWGVGVKAP